jgi:predicted phage terminase large subunit-like protein
LKWTKYISQKPTPKQAAFLLLETEEAFFGGAAGGGKSSSLLMSALQYVDIPNYAAIIFRRTYADLTLPGALLDRAREWLTSTDARWKDNEKTWVFPSGATLTFGYLENEQDKFRYQSSEFQSCVAKGTGVLMADGEWKPIEDIDIGDYVQTLEGPQPVLKVHVLGPKPVVRLMSALGEVLVSAQHRLLTVFDGWSCPMELISKESLPFGNIGEYSSPKYEVSSLSHEYLYSGLQQVVLPSERSILGMVDQDYGVSVKDYHNDCVKFGDGYVVNALPHKCSVPLVLYGQSPQLKGLADSSYEAHDVFSLVGLLDSPIGYRLGHDSYDELVQMVQVNDPKNIQQLNDAVIQNRLYQHEDGQDYIRAHNCFEYVHPYTMEVRPILGDALSLLSDITLEGEEEVLDLTVSSCSHYIIYPGIVSSNCNFDELTQFSETQYTYLFSRLRRLEGSNIPIRMRAASNPGDKGHQWVKQRFIIEGHQNSRPFIPAKLEDNPYLDQIAYNKSLMKLDPVTRAQLRSGDWDVQAGGNKFKRSWFEIVDVCPKDCHFIRFWDLAATEPKPGQDPDWTAGALVGQTPNGIYYIKDIRRARESPLGVQNLITQTAELDGPEVYIYMEQEPGSSGVNTIDHYRREVLKKFAFYGKKSSGDKEVRANPVSSQAEAGNVKLVRGSWINAFLEEAEQFPNGAHDDQIDAISGAYGELNNSSFTLWNSVLKKKIEAQKEAQNG